jgi:hypothetical protein
MLKIQIEDFMAVLGKSRPIWKKGLIATRPNKIGPEAGTDRDHMEKGGTTSFDRA